MNQLDIKRKDAYTQITKVACMMIGSQYDKNIQSLQIGALCLTKLDLKDSDAFKSVIKGMLETIKFCLGHSLALNNKWSLHFKAINNTLESIYNQIGDSKTREVCFIISVVEGGKPQLYRKYSLDSHDIYNISKGNIQVTRVVGEYNKVVALGHDDWTLTDVEMV